MTPSPRERLIAAMAASIEEKGYRETTVADVVRLARTSRRTFYEHFSNREACFLALFEQTTGETLGRIAGAVSPSDPWEIQVDNALDAYIDGVTAHPELQQSFVRELPALGDTAAQRQLEVLERFAAALVLMVDSGRQVQPEVMHDPLPFDVALIVVGGLRELLIISIQQGRDPHELRGSAGQVIKAIMRAIVV